MGAWTIFEYARVIDSVWPWEFGVGRTTDLNISGLVTVSYAFPIYVLSLRTPYELSLNIGRFLSGRVVPRNYHRIGAGNDREPYASAGAIDRLDVIFNA